MPSTVEPASLEPASIAEAMALIDRSLTHLVRRELVSSDEMADILLDVRALLVTASPPGA